MTRPPRLSRRLTPITPWPQAGTLEEHIRAEQLRVVFRQSLPAQLLSIAAAGVVCWALWSVGDHSRLRLWLELLIAFTLARIGLAVWFRRADPPPERMQLWEAAFVITLTAVTVVWGLGGWLVMPPSMVHQAIVYFFLMGVAGGAVASYSAHVGASTISILALMLPATLGFALQPATELRAMALGGALYLVAALRSIRNFGFFLRQNFDLSFELHAAYARAKDLARTDELTGLPNRRAFVEQGVTALEVARRHKRDLAVVMFDIDHFKKINDTHGHAAGDAVLREIASTVWHVARTSDTPGRLGGEEFAILLPETSGNEGARMAQRLREEFAKRVVTYDGVRIPLTCSFGVAEWQAGSDELEGLLRRADEALYRAKTGGRDRVVWEGTRP